MSGAATFADLLDSDYTDMISSMLSIVQSYEIFKNTTFFPLMLYNNSLNPNSISDNVFSNLLGNLKNASNVQAAMKFLTDLSDPKIRFSDTRTDDTTLEYYLFLSNTNVVDNLVNTFTQPFPAIGPSDSLPTQYDFAMRQVFLYVFYNIYSILLKRVQNTSVAAVYQSSFLNINSLTSASFATTDLLSYISSNAYFDPSMDLSTYIGNIFSLVQSYVGPISDPLIKNIFMCAYYPYFTYNYITNFIATKTIQANNKAPRSMIVRRMAILCTYMFQVYVIYSVYNMTIEWEPSSDKSAKLRMIMDNAVTQAFNQEKYMDDGLSVSDVHQEALNNFKLSDVLSKNNRDISLTRNNLNSVINEDARLTKSVNRSNISKLIWTILLIVYIVVLIALFFIKKWDYLYIISGVFAILVCITAILGVIKNK